MSSDDGRAPLEDPGGDDLDQAARTVLGDEAQKILPDGTKIWKAMGMVFIQGADESAGNMPGAANPDVQARLLTAAAELRKAAREAEQSEILDPQRNDFIKVVPD